MNQLNGHKEFARVVVDNYDAMEEQLHSYAEQNRHLSIENGALTAEVNMLREALERSDSDRIRLQAVSSTLTGQLLAVNAAIAEAMKLAVKHGVEATAEAAQRMDRAGEVNEAPRREGIQQPPQVDWRKDQ